MPSETPREKATRLLNAASNEVKRWQEFLRLLDMLESGDTNQQLEALGLLPPQPLLPLNDYQKDALRQSAALQAHKRRGKLFETEDAVYDIIKARGAPMHTGELLIELEKRGIFVGGSQPTSTLSARLSRANSLENVRPHGWRIKDAG